MVPLEYVQRSQNSSLTSDQAAPLWSGTNKNRDVSTGPLARPFARSLPRSWESELLMAQNDLVLSHSASVRRRQRRICPAILNFLETRYLRMYQEELWHSVRAEFVDPRKTYAGFINEFSPDAEEARER